MSHTWFLLDPFYLKVCESESAINLILEVFVSIKKSYTKLIMISNFVAKVFSSFFFTLGFFLPNCCIYRSIKFVVDRKGLDIVDTEVPTQSEKKVDVTNHKNII